MAENLRSGSVWRISCKRRSSTRTETRRFRAKVAIAFVASSLAAIAP